jgi:hypothetical protein
MCVSYKMPCQCGATSADLTMRDGVFGQEVVRQLYCPQCPRDGELNPTTTLEDNGWAIVFDMDAVGMRANLLPRTHEKITPEFLFDQGFCTWVGYCPGDMAKAAEEKAEIVKLMEVDPKAYIKAFTSWAKDRVVKLDEAGWRKARAAV